MCIFCFLEKGEQKRLRNRAQLSTDRFEHALAFYRKIYLQGFNRHLKENLCEKHGEMEQQQDVLIEIGQQSVKKLFNVFEDSYMKWINNDTNGAISSLEDYFKNNKLFLSVDLAEKLMFRSRYSKTRLSHWDMFHIPFNKRYLIKNQRYSLVGRPMLYLGFDPKYVLKEIGYKDEEKENYYMSAFYLKQNEEINVCDFRYNFPLVNDSPLSSLTKEKFDKEIIQKRFLISIISSICGFKRRNTDSNEFCEEYILPQIISEIVRNNEYDGLIYTSTHSEEERSKDSFIDSNAVIFTKYDKTKLGDVTYVYDKSLYRRFVITTAKKIGDMEGHDEKIVNNTIEHASLFDDLSDLVSAEISEFYQSHKTDNEIGAVLHRSVLYEIIVDKYMEA